MIRPGRLIYEMQAEICGALAHPVRLQILDILFEGEKNSRDLQKMLDIPKSNLSQHLSVLKEGGLIESRREGLFQYLSVSVPQLREACHLVKKVLGEKLAGEERKNLEAQRELIPPRRKEEKK